MFYRTLLNRLRSTDASRDAVRDGVGERGVQGRAEDDAEERGGVCEPALARGLCGREGCVLPAAWSLAPFNFGRLMVVLEVNPDLHIVELHCGLREGRAGYGQGSNHQRR